MGYPKILTKACQLVRNVITDDERIKGYVRRLQSQYPSISMIHLLIFGIWY